MAASENQIAQEMLNRRETWYKKLGFLKSELQNLIVEQLKIVETLENHEGSPTYIIINKIRSCISNIDLVLAGKGMSSAQELPFKELAALLQEGQFFNIACLIQQALDVPLNIQKPVISVPPASDPIKKVDVKSRHENQTSFEIDYSHTYLPSATNTFIAAERQRRERFEADEIEKAKNMLSAVKKAAKVTSGVIEAIDDFNHGDIVDGIKAVQGCVVS